jgi:PAS domain S-box-containing protein
VSKAVAENDLGVSAARTWPKAQPDFVDWLQDHEGAVTSQWARRLRHLSPFYGMRPHSELESTTTEAFAANLEAIAYGDLTRIKNFINYITGLRLGAGFPLSDVQKAFELFRSIVLESLRKSGKFDLLVLALEPLNAALSYTIHRFSDHFQRMHEEAIRSYAKELEQKVRQRTRELAGSEKRYKTLVEGINDGYFMIQKERIILANQAFCQMHGASLDKVLGRVYLNFVAPEDRPRVNRAYRQALGGKPQAGQLEYTRLGCPASQGATEIKSRVVDLGQGPVTIGICRDISRRVAMEAKVREHERLAYVGQLTALLSHEIRNPLSSLKMNLQILARNLTLDGFDQRRLEIAVHEVSRLEGILLQLLDHARPVQLNLAPVDLPGLIRSGLDLLEPKLSEKSICVSQFHPCNLPKPRLDAGKIEQVLINLFLNALEAVPPGGEIRIWTRNKKSAQNKAVELGVRDNGPGIAAGQKKHLFAPFVTSKIKGTGLGLSNVKRIVEAHGGSVAVKSRKGHGASFILRLPWRD